MFTRLEAALAQNRSLFELLSRFDEIGLPDGWVVAGAIAQTVWNLAFGKPAELGIKDVDLVYFDQHDLSPEAEAAHEHRLRHLFHHLPIRSHLIHRRPTQSPPSRPRRPAWACAATAPNSSAVPRSGSKIYSGSSCDRISGRSPARFTTRKYSAGARYGPG
jgi:hypothetical protein